MDKQQKLSAALDQWFAIIARRVQAVFDMVRAIAVCTVCGLTICTSASNRSDCSNCASKHIIIIQFFPCG